MNRALFFRMSVIILVFAFSFYFYIEKQNELTKLKIELPKKTVELTHIKEEIKELQYALEQLESPSRLMELSTSKQFSHLKYPFLKDILNVEEGLALNESSKKEISHLPALPIATTIK
jgi:hypothetical protein